MKLNAITTAGNVAQHGKAVNKTANDQLTTEFYAGNPPQSQLLGRLVFKLENGEYTLMYYPVHKTIPKGRIILESIKM